MANAHLLDRVSDSDYRVAVHIAIPNSNNSAGVNYRTALINSGLGGTTVLKDGDGTAGTISSAEKTSILSGAIFEVVTTMRIFTFRNTFGSANWLADADSAITQVTNDTLARLQLILGFYGGTR